MATSYTSTERGLFDLSGNRMPAKIIFTRFGSCWAFCGEDGKFTGEFVKRIHPTTFKNGEDGEGFTDEWVAVDPYEDRYGRSGMEEAGCADLKTFQSEQKKEKRAIAKLEALGYREGFETVEMLWVENRSGRLDKNGKIDQEPYSFRADGGYPKKKEESRC